MKARTLSLIGKALGLGIILATWSYRLFGLGEMEAVEVLAYVGGIVGLFADVAINLGLEKRKPQAVDPTMTTSAGA